MAYEPQMSPEMLEALQQYLAETGYLQDSQRARTNATQFGQVNPMQGPQGPAPMPWAQGEPYDPNGMFNHFTPRQGGRMGTPSPAPWESATATNVQGGGPSQYANDVVGILGRLGLPEDHLGYGPSGSVGTFAEARQRGNEIGLSPQAPDLMAGGLAFGNDPGLDPSYMAPGNQIEGMATAEPAPVGKPKKKGEFSEFFKVLKAAKSEDKKGTTRKALSDLAKQLDAPSEQTEDSKATGSPTI